MISTDVHEEKNKGKSPFFNNDVNTADPNGSFEEEEDEQERRPRGPFADFSFFGNPSGNPSPPQGLHGSQFEFVASPVGDTKFDFTGGGGASCAPQGLQGTQFPFGSSPVGETNFDFTGGGGASNDSAESNSGNAANNSGSSAFGMIEAVAGVAALGLAINSGCIGTSSNDGGSAITPGGFIFGQGNGSGCGCNGTSDESDNSSSQISAICQLATKLLSFLTGSGMMR